MKGVSIVDHCVFAQNVPSAPNVAHAQLVRGHLQNFWQTWSLLGANPRSILKDGYSLPFKIRPPLVRDPLIISGYANPLRNLYLKQALHGLIHKKAVEKVRTSLAFFNRLFIVKPNKKWRPILDLSALNKFLSVKTFKMETPETIRISLPFSVAVRRPIRDIPSGMGYLAGFQRHIFPHSYSSKISEIPRVSFPKPDLPVPGPTRWPLHSSYGVYLRGQRGKIDGPSLGYKNPPVPRRLVDSSPHQRIFPPGDPVPPCLLPGIGLGGEPTKIGVGTQTGFRICGLPIRPIARSGQTDPEPLGVTVPEGVSSLPSILQGQGIHVSNRSPYSNGEVGASGQAPYEAHSMAPQEKLEDSRVPGKRNPSPKVSSPTPQGVD